MNRFVFSGLILAAIVAVAFSELCTPDQWEGYEASIGGYVYHRRPGIIKEHNMVAYDAKNRRKASFINYVNNDFEDKFQIIVRYDDDNDDSGKIYTVDLKKGKCWIKKLDKPFRKACLPDDAEKVHDYTIGPLDGGLKVTGYLVHKKEVSVYMAVFNAGNAIIPVSENVHGGFMRLSFIQGIEFADITPGIKNETIFDIPKECVEDEFAISEYLQREHFILAV